MAWVLGTEIFHKNKTTKEKLKFPKVARCHSCFFRSYMVVDFFFLFLLLLLFPISAFFSEDKSYAAQEISFGSLCFSPYKRELLSSDFTDHFTMTKSRRYIHKNRNKKTKLKGCGQYDDRTLVLSHGHIISVILRTYLFHFHISYTKLTA